MPIASFLRALLPALVVVAAFPPSAFAQRALTDIPVPDPAAELAAMEVAEGYEVNLFAADPAIRKPLQINFDPRGRLWVSSSSVYPQLRPGEIPDDTVTILDDTDGDGVADVSQVFATGLHMPTAVLPGDGGCYVANATEMLHLADTDGDDRADLRRTVLSGFGTEDTHHLIHTFRWGVDARLFFNQSIYIHSHVETPSGVRRLNGGGMWRFRPSTLELDVFARGWVNPWGHAIDPWGRSLVTDGAGGEGINLGFPGAAYFTAVGTPRILHGMNPGSPKLCGLEILAGAHLPDDAQGTLVTHDFRANRVCRYRLTESGSGFESEKLSDLIRSPRVDFRPIDVKTGPDGAIYIADWYNPIIQHGEVDFRDDRRDRTHGRIWRVTAKGRPLVPRFDATTLSNGELIDLLTTDGWARDAARRVLVERGIDEVGPDLDTWASAARRAAPGTAGYHGGLERRCLELLWLRQGLDDGSKAAIDPALLSRVLTSPDPRARAAAARVVVDWADRLREPGVGPDGSLGPLDLLAPSVDDENAAVRLEGVRALAAVGRRLDPASPAARRAAALALHVVDHPRDDALDYAVWLAARDLEPAWLPALLAGSFDDGGKISRVLFAIRAAETTAASGWMMEQWQQAKLDGAKLTGADIDALLHAVALLGTAEELRRVFDLALAATTPVARSASLLGHLAESQRKRKVAPAGDLAGLTRLLTSPDAALESAAVAAAGVWQVEAAAAPLERIAADADRPLPRREAACRALGNLPGKAAHDALATLAAAPSTPEPLVAASLAALATRSLDEAAALTSVWLARGPGEAAIHEVLRAFLGARGGADRLAIALADVTLPAPTLRAVLQDVTAAGRPEPDLTAALERAGGSDSHPSITLKERAGILALVADGADAGRGRELYRREALRCVACHRIDREGGRVGPNLTAIGSAAQPDYLLDALLEPAKSVKEGYGSLVVVTTDGQVTSGIPVSRSDTELVLRTALDREVRLQLADIEEEAPGTSLMPAGLVDGLSAAEIADLVRYLSSLGR
jgi:putative heme-binding domain-containing protein